MMYSTFREYAKAYGITELWQLISDEQELLSQQLLRDYLADKPLDDYTPEELEALNAAVERVTSIISEQSKLMDSYFVQRYLLPLSDAALTANPLAKCCQALTRSALADDANNRTETMESALERWTKWLEQIAKGVIALIDAAGAQVSAGEPDRHYKAKTMPSGINWPEFP